MTRYETYLDDDSVYVGTADGYVEVGSIEEVVDVVGGHSWTITYTDDEKERYPTMDTSDEGLTIDVVDVMAAMTHGETFVKTLCAYPTESSAGDGVSPRLGLFVGKLLENLENGVA